MMWKVLWVFPLLAVGLGVPTGLIDNEFYQKDVRGGRIAGLQINQNDFTILLKTSGAQVELKPPAINSLIKSHSSYTREMANQFAVDQFYRRTLCFPPRTAF